jgi:DNA invertase Pin-like site-specific DNA recombinase
LPRIAVLTCSCFGLSIASLAKASSKPLTHLNRLTAAGVGCRSFTEPYFDSSGIFKDAVISILATIAKQERIRLSERVQAGLAAPAVGESGSASQKKIVDAAKIAQLRSQGHLWRESTDETGISKRTEQRTVSSLPQNV